MLNQASRWLKKSASVLAILASALALTGILLSFDFNFLEARLYDFRVSRTFSFPADPDIVLIAVDDQTTRELDEFAPLPIRYHTELLEILKRAQPRGVGYLIEMNRVTQMSDPGLVSRISLDEPAPVTSDGSLTKQRLRSKKGQVADADGSGGNLGTNQFLQNALHFKEQGVPFLLGTAFDVTGEVFPPAPLDQLPHAVAVVHKDGNVFAEDKVTRRALLTLYQQPSFHLKLAQELRGGTQSLGVSGAFHVPQAEGQYFFFRYHRDSLFCKKVDCFSEYQKLSFVDVLRGRVDLRTLRNKILLVGTLASDDSGDFVLTPYSKTSFVNPKLMAQAHILDSLLNDQGITRPPVVVNAVVTFLVTAFVLGWILSSTPLYGVIATICLAFVFLMVSQLLFQFYGLWIRESQPLVGIFLSYYLAVPYRLILEYKKRWEYQRKHQLMTQVEELKMNFLNLVTHDLKTPVARIQGLAESLQKKAVARLNDQENQTVRQIISSAEELNHFISSILELGKVDSNRIQIQVQSRDINQLIERCVAGFRAQAEAKRIELIMRLEPLFSIRVDGELIFKVLGNLIDNAIKYSPEDSEILIESREEGAWVVLSVQDQGFGMSEEECRNLFTRFYRVKNIKTRDVAGTGLGLYLTRYFVEAHQGKVEVQSSLGKGSLFQIYLPLSIPQEQLLMPVELNSIHSKESLNV